MLLFAPVALISGSQAPAGSPRRVFTPPDILDTIPAQSMVHGAIAFSEDCIRHLQFDGRRGPEGRWNASCEGSIIGEAGLGSPSLIWHDRKFDYLPAASARTPGPSPVPGLGTLEKPRIRSS